MRYHKYRYNYDKWVKQTGWNPFIFENTKKYYDKRSKVVHGSSTIDNNSDITSQDIITILQYSRDCILCCIILTEMLYNDSYKGKKNFKHFLLDKIDEYILDITKREQLIDKLKQDKIFNNLKFSLNI